MSSLSFLLSLYVLLGLHQRSRNLPDNAARSRCEIFASQLPLSRPTDLLPIVRFPRSYADEKGLIWFSLQFIRCLKAWDSVGFVVVRVPHQLTRFLSPGTRLAFLQLSDEYNWIPYFGALLYSIVTPLVS